MDFDWKSVVRSVAPILGTVISGGNPLVGMGIKVLSNTLLGKEDGTEDEISAAIQNATPEKLLELQTADNAFKLEMSKLGLDEKKLAFDDADSARKREMVVKDKTPAVLAYLTTLMFSAALVGLYMVPIPDPNKATVYLMLGSLGTVWITAMQYYHGTSRSSAKKDDMIQGLKKQ